MLPPGGDAHSLDRNPGALPGAQRLFFGIGRHSLADLTAEAGEDNANSVHYRTDRCFQGTAVNRIICRIGDVADQPLRPRFRSAERRVGKEGASTCRSRWSTDHSKKKKNKK